MNSKDKAFLDKFYVKELRNLTVLGNFGATGFSIMGGFKCYSTYQSKNDKIAPIRVPQPNFYILSLLLVEMGH